MQVFCYYTGLVASILAIFIARILAFILVFWKNSGITYSCIQPVQFSCPPFHRSIQKTVAQVSKLNWLAIISTSTFNFRLKYWRTRTVFNQFCCHATHRNCHGTQEKHISKSYFFQFRFNGNNLLGVAQLRAKVYFRSTIIFNTIRNILDQHL